MRRFICTIAFLAPALAWAEAPYAGMQARPIKALSDQQLSDLRAGQGMGLALAAELNRYPGLSHVLELADQLGLSSEQRSKVEEMFAAMKTETTSIGDRMIEEESNLDRQFAHRIVSPESLRSATTGISNAQGELREAHLKYHLLTTPLLDKDQLEKYPGCAVTQSRTPRNSSIITDRR